MTKTIETDCGNVTTLADDDVPNEIFLSESAQERVKTLVATEEDGSFLRVAVQAGGCTGFQYYFGFDTDIEDDDIVKDFGDVKVVIDTTSIELMKGATIDYVKTMLGEHFRVINDLAKSTCGCGSSFGV